MLQPLLLLLLLVAVHGDDSECPSLGMNGMEAGAKLHRLARDALGIDDIQSGFDMMSKMAASIPDGEVMVKKLAQELEKNFKQFYGLVDELRNEVEVAVSQPEVKHSMQPCCNLSIDSLHYVEDYKREINSQNLCYFTSDDEPREKMIPAGGIQTAMRRNEGKGDSSLKWQYVGTLDGLFLSYPAINDCDPYDPRIRPWYVEAATPMPKAMVLVVDATAGHNRNLTIKAVNVILDAVNPNDLIGLVRFGSKAYMTHSREAPACFSHELASATPDNIKILQNFINDEPVMDEANGGYKEALLAGFDLIKKSSGSTSKNRRPIIIFLTHKNLTNIEYLQDDIAGAQEQLDNSIQILTYGLGTDIKKETQQVLQSLATTNQVTMVQSDKDLHSTVGTFYQFFYKTVNFTTPIITAPYIDEGGLGMVVSVCLPAYYPDHKLFGVTCADGQLLKILFNITNVEDARGSYAFIIDDEGHTFVHPKLPAIGDFRDRPPLVDISTLEQEPDARPIIQAMKEGKSGKASFKAIRFSSGHPRQLTLSYHWMKVPDTSYTICLVLSQDHVGVSVTGVKVKPYYLHPALVKDEGKHLCLHQEQNATFESSSVVLNDEAFIENPAHNEDYDFKAYHSYFTDPGTDNRPEFLQPGTKSWVRLSGLVDDVWTNPKSNSYNLYIYWRYLITVTGINRIFPGSSFEATNFTQTWYKKTITNRDLLVLTSSPRPFTKKRVITLSTSLYISRQNITRPSSDIPVAVVGGDFDEDYILYSITRNIPNCQSPEYRCLLVDDAGYILTHSIRSEQTENTEDQALWESHITQMEPVVSSILMERGIIAKHRCINHARLRIEYEWMLQLREGLLSFCNDTVTFEIHIIYRTNAYLIIVSEDTPLDTNPCQCQKSVALQSCTSYKKTCRCPCYDAIDFDHCKNHFRESYNDILPECPKLAFVAPVAPQSPAADTLSPCITFTCTNIQDYNECRSRTQCEWCSGGDGPGCYSLPQCAGLPSYRPSSSTSNNQLLLLLLLLLLIPLIIIILIFLCKRYPEQSCIKKSRDSLTQFKEQAMSINKRKPPSTINTASQATMTANPYTEDTPHHVEQDPSTSTYAEPYQAHKEIAWYRPKKPSLKTKSEVAVVTPQRLHYADLHHDQDESGTFEEASFGNEMWPPSFHDRVDGSDSPIVIGNYPRDDQEGPIALSRHPKLQNLQDIPDQPHRKAPRYTPDSTSSTSSSPQSPAVDHPSRPMEFIPPQPHYIPSNDSIIGDNIYIPQSIHEGYTDDETTLGSGSNYFFPEGYHQNIVPPYDTVTFDDDLSSPTALPIHISSQHPPPPEQNHPHQYYNDHRADHQPLSDQYLTDQRADQQPFSDHIHSHNTSDFAPSSPHGLPTGSTSPDSRVRSKARSPLQASVLV